MAQQAILAAQRRRHDDAAQAQGFLRLRRRKKPKNLNEALAAEEARLLDLFHMWDEDGDAAGRTIWPPIPADGDETPVTVTEHPACVPESIPGAKFSTPLTHHHHCHLPQAAPHDPLGGAWRCLRTGRVVHSVARIVDGRVHAGALVGYNRPLAAAVLASLAAEPRSTATDGDGGGCGSVLALGLGGGSVPSFLAAHAPPEPMCLSS